MLEERDLQAIAQLMDARISASEERMAQMMDQRISASEERMAQRMDQRISASEERMAQRMDEKLEVQQQSIMQDVSVMIDQKLEVQRQSIMRDVSAMIDQKLERQKDEILDEAAHRMKVLLDTEVTMRFNLLAEGQEEILRRMPTEEDMELIDSRITTLEIAVKKLNRRVAGLRPAQ